MSDITKIHGKNEMTDAQIFEVMEAASAFQIEPCDGMVDLENPSRFTKMELSSGQKMQISAFLQQTPQVLAAGTLANVYMVTFPEGLPHTLTALKQGGYGSMIRANGQIAGSASFYPVATQAAALGAFSAMSAVTGQYFLTQINSELKIVNQKLDEILGFLYGEKKAELMAEISFVKYAHNNFSTIMMHEDQRVATIGSLQAAKKVAMKDIEFYLSDLDATAKRKAKDYDDLQDLMDKALRITDSIEMSRQLYVVSSLLELYYSQNYENEYIGYIEADMISFINKCDSRILSGLSTFQGKLTDYKAKPLEKTDDRQKRIDKITIEVEPYKDGNDSPIRKALESSLEALHKKAKYYVDSKGSVFIKRTA